MSRRLAFVRALAFVALVACDKKEDIDDDVPVKKKPKPKPTATATASTSVEVVTAPCPDAQPKDGTACTKPEKGACHYDDHMRCDCTPDGWSCKQRYPTKGPLPPPDLPAARA
jgi:hypothetical protein